MQYTCAYWKDATTLDQAQENKLHLICRKIQLAAGDDGARTGRRLRRTGPLWRRVWLPRGQLQHFPRSRWRTDGELCKGLPVRFEQKDYREAAQEKEPFDRVVSVGSLRAHRLQELSRISCELVHERLKPERPVSAAHHRRQRVLHLHRSLDRQVHLPERDDSVHGAIGHGHGRRRWVVEDWHNFGPDYDKTLMAWWQNFDRAWPALQRQVWRPVLSHVEVLPDGLRGWISRAQASALADRPLEGRHSVLHAGPVGLRSYGSRRRDTSDEVRRPGRRGSGRAAQRSPAA